MCHAIFEWFQGLIQDNSDSKTQNLCKKSNFWVHHQHITPAQCSKNFKKLKREKLANQKIINSEMQQKTRFIK